MAKIEQAVSNIQDSVELVMDKVYPIGSVYISVVNQSPTQLLSFGVWERIANGHALVGVDENDSIFSTSQLTGGSKTHTLTTEQMPPHGHNIQNNWTTNTNHIHGNAIPKIPQGIQNGTAGLNTSVFTEVTGNGRAHNNLQPYFTVFIWKRMA